MLTFEKIRDLERQEKENKKLQSLPETFLEEVKEYLHKKKNSVDDSSAVMELENVKKTIKRLFEIREEKIIQGALYSIKTGFPQENLTESEEKIFAAIFSELKTHRDWFFEEYRKEPEQKEVNETSGEKEENVRMNKDTLPEVAKEEVKAVYKIVKNLPRFIGPDLLAYDLREGATLGEKDLPNPLNDLLLKKGIIVKS